MQQELTTPPPLLPELSLEEIKSTCASSCSLTWEVTVELCIIVVLFCLALTIGYGFSLMNSEALQLAQSSYEFHNYCDITAFDLGESAYLVE